MDTDSAKDLARHLAGNVHMARRRYQKRLERCQKEISGRAVHQLRVETRRILALLTLLEALHLDIPIEKLARRFKKRLDVFSDLRDTQVQLRLLKPMWPEYPEAAALKKFLGRREEKLIAKVAHKIDVTKYARLSQCLKEIEKCLNGTAKGKSSKAIADAVSAGVRDAFRGVVQLRDKVRRQDVASIHKMRVAFKLFRYLMELLQPFLPGITDKHLDRMKTYQVAAGDIQDIEVLLRCLSQTVKKRKLNPGALRNLRNELLRRRQQTIDSFMSRIDDLSTFEPKLPAPGRVEPKRRQ